MYSQPKGSFSYTWYIYDIQAAIKIRFTTIYINRVTLRTKGNNEMTGKPKSNKTEPFRQPQQFLCGASSKVLRYLPGDVIVGLVPCCVFRRVVPLFTHHILSKTVVHHLPIAVGATRNGCVPACYVCQVRITVFQNNTFASQFCAHENIRTVVCDEETSPLNSLWGHPQRIRPCMLCMPGGNHGISIQYLYSRFAAKKLVSLRVQQQYVMQNQD